MKKFLYLTLFSLIIFLSFIACNRDVSVKEKKAREYFNEYKYNKVIDILETIKPSRRTVGVNLLLGRSYCTRFEFTKADHILKNTFERHPSMKDTIIAAYMSIARRFESRKRTELAVKAYNSLLSIEREYNLGNGFYTLGHHCYAQNDLVKAKMFLEKGVENIKDFRLLTKTKAELMDTYETLGMLALAIEISIDDPEKDIIYRRGKILHKLAKELFSIKEFDSALVYCESILEQKSPRTVIDDTYFLMGEIYSECGDYKNALRCYKEVVKLDKFGKNELAVLARKKIAVLTQLNKGVL